MQHSSVLPDGVRHFPGQLGAAAQRQLVEEITRAIAVAPLYRAEMPRSGTPMSVRMTNLGPLGWFTDKDGGYRYVDRHPSTGKPWPPIPAALLQLWLGLAGYDAPPEACLVNYYGAAARMGSHRDCDEAALEAPVLSVSLGDDAVFHVGGRLRTDPKVRLRLQSGDVLLMGGASRLAYHGVDRVLAGTSDLLPEGGRYNLTLRRVTKPAPR